MYAETILDIAMNHSDTLIEKAKNGDRAAQGKLVNLWFKRIYNFAHKYFADHDLAMEIAQETFIVLHRKICQLESVDKFKPWLYRITANLCHAESRKMQSADRLRMNDDWQEHEEEIASAPFYNPDKQFQREELQRVLQKALNALSTEQRAVVIMKEYEGLKFREIAEILSCSENTVKSRLYYGLSHLRQILLAKNITTEILEP